MTGISALAFTTITLSCCCWRGRQNAAQESQKSVLLFGKAAQEAENLLKIKQPLHSLKCIIEIKQINSPSVPSSEVFDSNVKHNGTLIVDSTLRTLSPRVWRFIFDQRSQLIDINTLDHVHIIILGKKHDGGYWLDSSKFRITDRAVEAYESAHFICPNGDFSDAFDSIGVIPTPQIDQKGNFIR